jgi:hypothetical protein
MSKKMAPASLWPYKGRENVKKAMVATMINRFIGMFSYY